LYKLETYEMMKAAELGYLDTIKLLLAAGLDVNTKSKNGSTALMLASFYDQPETALEEI